MPQQLWNDFKRLLPVFLCWLIMMLGDSAAGYTLEHSASGLRGAVRDIVITAIIGFFFGQFALAAIVGGLLGRTWLAGWLIAVGLTAVAILMVIFGVLPHGVSNLPERVAMGALAPTLTLAACGPLMLMRALRGWSLTLGTETSVVKQRASVEDLLLLSVAVACSLSWLRVVNVFSQGFSETQRGTVIAAIFFTFSLLLIVPATAVTFRSRNWRGRLLGWAGITLGAFLVVLLTNVFLFSNVFWTRVWSATGYAALGIGSCALTIGLGATALLASGFKLTRFAKVTSPEQEEAEESQTVAAQRSTRRQARWLTGGVALSTLLVGGWLGFVEHRRAESLERIRGLLVSQGTNGGGSVSIIGDEVVSLTVDKATTDESFHRYKSFRGLERLSLAESRITDSSLAEMVTFPKLKALDLSGTAITDVGLDHLAKRYQLSELSVANTRVSLDKTLQTAKILSVASLDLSDLDLDDEQLEKVSELKGVHTLALRGNPITDAGLAKLLQFPVRIDKLDLSNTSIDGSGLQAGTCPYILVLDGTKITDANLIAIMKARPGISVSIKNTAITARVLQQALATRANLSLGDGLISEEDLLELRGASFSTFGLNGPEFTGACLASLTQVHQLDLSRSGITDETFARLAQHDHFLSRLSVAHTDVTDAILPTIQQLTCFELDVRGTKLTANGLLQYQQPGSNIFVDFNQFTPQELVALRGRFNVMIHTGPTQLWNGFEARKAR